MRIVIVTFFVLAVAGCSRDKSDASSAWRSVAEKDLTEVQAGQHAVAVAARDALFERLSARLTAVVSKDGPAAAIAVCQSEAPTIAETVGREKNVRIGRTALKLRNPKNQPPEWAASTIAQKPGNPVFFAGPEGKLGTLLPIRLKAQCLTCHGPAETLPPPVRAALSERYPSDQAVGFAEGDLRGWFWVEVPPAK